MQVTNKRRERHFCEMGEKPLAPLPHPPLGRPPVGSPVVCSRRDGNIWQQAALIGSVSMQAKWARHTARFQGQHDKTYS